MQELIKILLPILIALESGGDPNAIGDYDRNNIPQAVGILQIHPIMVEDVNRILDCPAFNLKDRYDPNASIYMAAVFIAHYGTNKVQGLSQEEQVVVLARMWVSGPNGHKKKVSEDYGNKARRLYRANLNK